MKNYYSILEIREHASADEIVRAYRQMIQVWHPDRFQTKPDLLRKAEQKTKEINEAYRCLSDPSLKSKHDYELGEHRTSTESVKRANVETATKSSPASLWCPNPACRVGLRLPAHEGCFKVTCPNCRTAFVYEYTADAPGNASAPDASSSSGDAAGSSAEQVGRYFGRFYRRARHQVPIRKPFGWVVVALMVLVVYLHQEIKAPPRPFPVKPGLEGVWDWAGRDIKAPPRPFPVEPPPAKSISAEPVPGEPEGSPGGPTLDPEGASGNAIRAEGGSEEGISNALIREEQSPLVPLPLPETGYEVRHDSGGPYASLRVVTPKASQHFWIKLVDAQTEESVLAFFVRDGHSWTVRVPLGYYQLMYAAGKEWHGDEELFGGETKYYKAQERFDFQDSAKGWTVELILQPHGNLRASPITAMEFNKGKQSKNM